MSQESLAKASDSTGVQQGRLLGIEMLRGLASILIVMHHTHFLLGESRYGGIMPFHGLFGEFHVGVDFFFVLSGFIIAWVHWDDIGNRSKIHHYAARRFTRIFPAYWAILIPLTFLYHAFPSSGLPELHEWSNFFISFFLVPYPKEMILGVAWTLVYEVCFYAFFGWLIFIGRGYLWILLAWGVSILLFPLSGVHEYYASFIFSACNLNFLLGMGAAMLLRSRRIPHAGLVLTLGGGIFLAAMLGKVALILIDYPLASPLLFGLCAALAIMGIVELERSGRLTISPRMQIFGSASYSIYLVHPVAMSFFLLTVWPFVKTLPADIICVPMIVFGVAAGILYHKVIEKPVIGIIRRSLT
ncbi:MAG: acyltransferase [Alphaproteobacteria bacterium]|nr:acyltransferase [Alphaproteobacteria bacterium]